MPISRFPGFHSCRRCGDEHRAAAVFVALDERTLGELIQQSQRPVFIVLHASQRMAPDDMKHLLEAATTLGEQASIVTVSADGCRTLIANWGIAAPIACVFVQDRAVAGSIEVNRQVGRLGLWMRDTVARLSMPPLERLPRPCPWCSGLEFIRCLPVEHSPEDTDGSTTFGLRRMAVTRRATLTVTGSGQGKSIIRAQEPKQRAGELEAFVCRTCGHVQWMASKPDKIPIGAAHRTQLVHIGAKLPYR